MSRMFKIISTCAVLVLLAFAIATPVRAFESREGQNIVIEKGEVVDDDLYLSADTITVNGTIKGDLIAVGKNITVNGTVEGDLMAAGQSVVINGHVNDDARIAGAGLLIGSAAVIGDDLIAAGASLETQKGSQVGGDLVVGSAQALLAGDVTGDVTAGTAALELRGNFGGNVHAYVDVTSDRNDMPPMNMFMTDMPISIPSVPAGLTVSDSARIAGDLEYTSALDLNVPSAAVAGKITRTAPQVGPAMHVVEPTPAEKVSGWMIGLLRRTVTLILVGLFLSWLFPNFINSVNGKLQTQFWPSLGWGFVGGMTYIFVGSVVFVATLFLAILFWIFTLSGLGWAVFSLGISILVAMDILLLLAVAYLAAIIVGSVLGKWLLGKIAPSLADHKHWPMILGVLVIVAVVGLLRFPLVPFGFFGNALYFAIVLFGLGALWLWGREKFTKQPAAQ